MTPDVPDFDFNSFNKTRNGSIKRCYHDAKKQKILFERDVGIFIKNIEFIIGNSSWKNLYEEKSKFLKINVYLAFLRK